MSRSSPASAPWADVCYGVDDTPERGVFVKAVRRRGRLAFSRVQAAELQALTIPPRNTVMAACLHQQRSFARWLTAPLASARKARRVFPAILDVQLPFPIEDCEYDVLDVQASPDKTSTRGLAVGARAVEIERRLDELRALGVEPQVLDQEGLALWTRALDELPPGRGGAEEQRLRVVVYAAGTRATLAVGRRQEFLGAHALRRLEPDAVHRLIVPYATGAAPDVEWVWTGPLAGEAEAVRALQSVLSERWPGPSRTAAEPEAFLARAVAARALSSGPSRWNFRRGRFSHPVQQAREARAPYVLAAGLLAAGLALCAVNLGWQVESNRRLGAVQRLNLSLAEAIVRAPVPFQQEVRSARRALDERTRLMEPFAAAEPVLRETLGKLLAVARDEGLALETVSLRRQSATIRGAAPKWRQAGGAMKRFEQLGWTAKLERKGDSGESPARFVMTLGWTP